MPPKSVTSPTKTAAIIFVHNDPNGLERLVRSLLNHFDFFCIHVDRDTEEAQFKTQIDKFANDKIHFCSERLPCYWGHWNLAEAALNAVKELHSLNWLSDVSHIQTLSGACYPITSGFEYRSFLRKNEGIDFISVQKLPIESLPLGGLNRTSHHFDFLETWWLWKFRLFRKLFQNNLIGPQLLYAGRPIIEYPPLLAWNRNHTWVRKAWSLMRFTKLPYRKKSLSFDLWKGSDWYCLSLNTWNDLIDFSMKDSEVINHFKPSLFPPESFFHTLIASVFTDKVIKPNLHYVDWSGNEKPAVLDESYINRLLKAKNESLFFARKVDNFKSIELKNRIDGLFL